MGTSGTITVGGVPATITSYSSTSVTFTIPTSVQGGYLDVALTSGGKTASVKLFVGKMIAASASTTADIQAALDTLPRGSALMLGGREYTWNASTDKPLNLDNKSLYGQGSDKTVVQGDLYLFAQDSTTVNVDSLKLSGDHYYLGNGQLNIASVQSAMATRQQQAKQQLSALSKLSKADVNTARMRSTSLSSQAAAAGIRAMGTGTIGANGFVFNKVVIKEVTAGEGYFDNEAWQSFIKVTDSNIELNSSLYLSSWSLSVSVTNSTLTNKNEGNSSQLEVEAIGDASILNSTVNAGGRFYQYSEGGDATVKDSTITVSNSYNSCEGCQYQYARIASDNGNVLVTGSKISVKNADLTGGQPGYSYLNIYSWAGTIMVENNPLIHADRELSIYSYRATDNQNVKGAGKITVRGNTEVSVGNDTSGGNSSTNGSLNIYSESSDVTVSNNARLSSNNSFSIYSYRGDVSVTNNPDVSALNADGANGSLQVSTNNANNVTFTGNTVQANGKVSIESKFGQLNLAQNKVTVSGTNSPSFSAISYGSNNASVTGNTIVAKDESAATAAHVGILVGLGSLDFSSGWGEYTPVTAMAKGTYAISGNTFTAAGSSGSTTNLSTGYGTLTATGNTLTSAGGAYLESYAGNASYMANTFTVASGGQFKLWTRTGFDADGDNSNGFSDPSNLTFSGNIVGGIADVSSVTQTVDHAESGNIVIGDNTFSAN